MSNDFQINTLIETNRFNNTLLEFNKAFKASNTNSVNNVSDGTNFDEIFNAMMKEPLQGSIQYGTLDLKTNKPNFSNIKNTADTIGSGIKNSLAEVSEINKKADTDLETFASGGDISIHDVMISAQKSNLAMGMAIQLRNQMLNAYNEFKNMSM